MAPVSNQHLGRAAIPSPKRVLISTRSITIKTNTHTYTHTRLQQQPQRNYKNQPFSSSSPSKAPLPISIHHISPSSLPHHTQRPYQTQTSTPNPAQSHSQWPPASSPSPFSASRASPSPQASRSPSRRQMTTSRCRPSILPVGRNRTILVIVARDRGWAYYVCVGEGGERRVVVGAKSGDEVVGDSCEAGEAGFGFFFLWI